MASMAARYDEAVALHEGGDVEAAVEKLQALLGEEPGYSLAHAALSVYLGELGRHEEAVEHAQKVCELEAHDPFSYVALSLICQKAGRIQEAEQALMLARQADFAAQQRDKG